MLQVRYRAVFSCCCRYLAVLGAHDDVDDGIDARGQVDEDVAEDVEGPQVHLGAGALDDRHRQVAHDERHENHQNLHTSFTLRIEFSIFVS